MKNFQVKTKAILVSNYEKDKAERKGRAYTKAVRSTSTSGVQVAVVSPKIQTGNSLVESPYHSERTHRALILYVTPPA